MEQIYTVVLNLVAVVDYAARLPLAADGVRGRVNVTTHHLCHRHTHLGNYSRPGEISCITTGEEGGGV